MNISEHNTVLLYAEIENGGRLKANIYDKCDDFTFPIVNFPFISNKIPATPTHGVYISQRIRYSKDCARYSDFLDRAQLPTQKLLKQGNATYIIWSSSRTIHLLNGNEFPFTVRIFFSVLYNRQEFNQT
jgi:hypothetical protein